MFARMPAAHRNAQRAKRAFAEAAATATDGPHVAFTIESLESFSQALKSGRMKVDKITFTDDQQPGLRAIVRTTGNISFHAHYDFKGSRPMIKVGEWPGTPLKEARELTKTIRALADKGIDVQEGLLPRLLRELKQQGTKWRP
jgi:hypothetical protein